MDRSIKQLVTLVVLPIGGLACLAGLGVGLWSLLDGVGVESLLLRGAIALAGALLVSLLAGLLLGLRLSRQAAQVRTGIAALAARQVPPETKGGGASELLALQEGIVDLAATLRAQRKEADERARLASRQARQDALARFTEGVAREVQKPLAGVIGFAEMALKQPGVEGQLKNYLTMIAQEARSGRESLENIIRTGRDEAFATEPLDLNELLVQTSRSILATRDAETIRVQMNLSENLPKVLGDATQLMQVFATLVENAREAMLPQGGTIELSTNLQADGQAVIMVKDSGRGIPEADWDRVFTPFFTTKGNRRGAGLNLAIADSIVRRHGGRMDFFSAEGTGSVFFVTFPRPETEGS